MKGGAIPGKSTDIFRFRGSRLRRAPILLGQSCVGVLRVEAFIFLGFDGVLHDRTSHNADLHSDISSWPGLLGLRPRGFASPNVQDEPRPWLARLVLLGARDVTAMVVGSSALLGISDFAGYG